MEGTVKQIGRAIKAAAEFLPIRNHAAALAATAPPKDYVGQLNAVYNDFIKRWRYVRDPRHKELVTFSPRAVWKYTLAGDGVGVGLGKGAGDCDCATVAIGGELLSIGFPVRIATTADKGAPAGNMFGHVFAQAQLPNGIWVTVDPVLHPRRPFGATTPHARIAYWDLNGRLIGRHGNIRGPLGAVSDSQGGNGMQASNWGDYEMDYSGMFGVTNDGMEPTDWENVGLRDWGSYSPMMGVLSADDLPGIQVEVDHQREFSGLARTPMIEIAPDDYEYVQAAGGYPYDGMLGLGDDGVVYQYDGSLGFFKKLFRKIRKKVRKVAKRIGRGLKNVLKKLPGGKAILKIAGKIHKVAMKIVRPLMKFVGKYASKLAPIAALIPGYGPAIAAGLHTAGKVAKLMTKWDVKIFGKKGKVRTLYSKDKRRIKGLQRDLAVAAKKLERGKRMARGRRRRR